MSGDVQPRKRKDKKRKREDDESSHGVHSTKMGSDDVHLHVQEDHGTGGHWCAKLLFFILLSILVGLIGLIIMENRGLADLDTPLSESRYSNYFDGWVEERVDDHEHDAVEASIEEHEEHDEPFEEIEDHSEPTEEDADEHDEENEEHEEEDEEEEKTEIENEENEEETDNNIQDSNQQQDDVDDDNNDDDAENDQEEEEEEDQEDEENEEDNNDEDEVVTKEQIDSQEDTPENMMNDEEEEDDDGMDENSVEVVENDAQEEELLQEKAKADNRNAVDSKENEEDTEADEDDVDQNNVNDAAAGATQSWASAQIKPKAGGQQSYDDDDDDDEVDSFERELHAANEEMMREHHENALLAYTQLSEKYPNKPEIILALANALDKVAEKQRSNVLLKKALETFQHYLSFGTKVNDQDFRDVAKLCIKRMRFLGYLMPSIQVHKQIMARFSLEAWPRNDLAVTYLLMNRMAEAKLILKETLRHWPNNGFALVHYGFVLKQLDMDYEQAVVYLERGIASEEPGTQDGRFYFNLGDALQRLGRNEEALKVYDKGASLGLFPSRYQRSLYNEPNLRAKPFWSKNETSYEVYLKRFEQNWQAIKIEGLNLLSKDNYFKNESENLRQTGDWKQFELYVRGQQIKQNCQKAPITCSLISDFPAARDCRRGQIKFSVIHPNTHVWPHCGPTNCRLRAHLGLVVPPGLRLRVAEEENLWKEGEFIIFDDSFEHEVWHNGNSSRLVLIIDLWHPDLSKKQREQLAAI